MKKEDKERNEAMKRTGNVHTRTAQFAFMDGWNERAQRERVVYQRAFIRALVICCYELTPTILGKALDEVGIYTASQMKKIGISKEDIDKIKPTLNELKRRRALIQNQRSNLMFIEEHPNH